MWKRITNLSIFRRSLSSESGTPLEKNHTSNNFSVPSKKSPFISWWLCIILSNFTKQSKQKPVQHEIMYTSESQYNIKANLSRGCTVMGQSVDTQFLCAPQSCMTCQPGPYIIWGVSTNRLTYKFSGVPIFYLQ